MKTFRRYFLSYLAILLLPIVVLTFFIFRYVMTYCGNQILAHSESTLEQLQTALSIQVDQLDAMTLQTVSRSEFFARNLAQTAGFYSVQRTLSSWQLTSGFASEMYFYSTGAGKIYSDTSVYDAEEFFSARLENSGVDEAAFARALASEARGGCWLSSQPWLGDRGKVLYISKVRASAAVDNVMIYAIDLDALDALAQNAMLYAEGRTLLCDAEGTPVYDTATGGGAASEEVARLMENGAENSGEVDVGGSPQLYARILESGDGLLYFSFVPQTVARMPVVRLQNLFFAGLACIFALSAGLIHALMRITYQPLAELESDAKGAELAMEYTDDMVLNIRNALKTMKNSHRAIVDKVSSLNKERLVLRLLMGGYRSLDDFNADGAPLRMRLQDGPWRILLMRFSENSNTEDFADQLTDAMRGIFDGADPLFLELSEDRAFVYIVGEERFFGARALEERLAQAGIAASVFAGTVCRSPSDLALSYARALRDSAAKETEATAGAYPAELFHALIHALQFGEKERIPFTLMSISESLKGFSGTPEALEIAYEALHQAQLWLEGQSDAEGVRAVRQLKNRLFDSSADVRQTAAFALERLGELLLERIPDKPSVENPLVKEMLEFLEGNFRDADLTVQRTAERYDLSISNLSHYFKKHVGVSVSEYIENLRIQAAKNLLRNTQMNVSDVAVAVGYAYPATFMRAFKKVCGQSPTAYRKLDDAGAFRADDPERPL